MKYYSSEQGGFSLVETLVAITILLIVIIGPMTISATAARSTSFSSEQVIAFFLAQEGAEIAQKARDDKILENFYPLDPNDGWDEFTDPSSLGVYEDCFKSTGCGLELNTDPTGSLNVFDCSVSCLLYYDAAGDRSRYTYNSVGTTATVYTRVIKLEPTLNTNEVKVTSKVTWRTGSQRAAQEAVVETYLFNIYGN